MTVKQLKDLLDLYPDGMPVFMINQDGNEPTSIDAVYHGKLKGGIFFHANYKDEEYTIEESDIICLWPENE